MPCIRHTGVFASMLCGCLENASTDCFPHRRDMVLVVSNHHNLASVLIHPEGHLCNLTVRLTGRDVKHAHFQTIWDIIGLSGVSGILLR